MSERGDAYYVPIFNEHGEAVAYIVGIVAQQDKQKLLEWARSQGLRALDLTIGEGGLGFNSQETGKRGQDSGPSDI